MSSAQVGYNTKYIEIESDVGTTIGRCLLRRRAPLIILLSTSLEDQTDRSVCDHVRACHGLPVSPVVSGWPLVASLRIGSDRGGGLRSRLIRLVEIGNAKK